MSRPDSVVVLAAMVSARASCISELIFRYSPRMAGAVRTSLSPGQPLLVRSPVGALVVRQYGVHEVLAVTGTLIVTRVAWSSRGRRPTSGAVARVVRPGRSPPWSHGRAPAGAYAEDRSFWPTSWTCVALVMVRLGRAGSCRRSSRRCESGRRGRW
jgi:hypothetical protein